MDTSEWKVYRNEAYGFEVKYPPKLRYKDFGSTGPNLITTVGFAETFSDELEIGGIDAVDIIVEVPVQNLEEIKASLAKPVVITDFMIDAKKGFRAIGDFYGTRTDLIVNSKHYIIVIGN